jgi:hypothetical protein
MFWEDLNDPLPQRLENLMQWALKNLQPVRIGKESYGPRLGVSASGLALIYYTILQVKKKRQAPLNKALEADLKIVTEVLTDLRILSASTSQYIPGPYNYPHFEPHITDLAKYVKRLGKHMETAAPHITATTRRSYIWLDGEDIDWWVTAIRKTLDDYLLLIREKTLALSDVERLGERLECSVFAPLDISQGLPTLGPTAMDGMPLDKEMQERSTTLAKEAFEVGREMYGPGRESRYLYLSWDLVAFDYWKDFWREQLIHRTMLALWTAWPHDMIWGPKLPKGFSSPPLSLDEAIPLLTDLLPHLRRYFLSIKEAHHLSLSKAMFEKSGRPQILYPPTFYFADPTPRLTTTEDYVKNAGVHQLIRNCIGYDDPYAETLSWSTLEGNMATVRGETIQVGHYKARYLLLPIALRPVQAHEIGSDLDYIVDLLTFLEYTTGLEAEDFFKKAHDIESRREVDSDTIGIVDSFSRKLAYLVPTLPGEALKSGAEEFAELQLLLGRVQYGLEKMKGEAGQIGRQYDRLNNRNNEFLHETLITSPVSNLPHLPVALTNAYPYRSLLGSIRTVPDFTAQLANSSERVRALLGLLSTAISDNERKLREDRDRSIQRFVAIIAIATLLLGLPTFFPNANAQAIFTLFKDGTAYTSNTGIIALVVLALALLVAFMPYLRGAIVRIGQYMTTHRKSKQEQESFSRYVKQFWDLADHTAYMYRVESRRKEGLQMSTPELHSPLPNRFEKDWESNRGADNIDRQATSIMHDLWRYLNTPLQFSRTNKQNARSDSKQQTSEDLIAQVRILSRLIHVFVLRPDLIPLPRALCILRYKSLQFLEKPTISDNDFRNSLTYAKFTPDQVTHLQHWLSEPENQKQIKQNTVNEVAEALKKAGVTAHPREDVVSRWHGNLFS